VARTFSLLRPESSGRSEFVEDPERPRESGRCRLRVCATLLFQVLFEEVRFLFHELFSEHPSHAVALLRIDRHVE
jgi:hypothetical protein